MKSNIKIILIFLLLSNINIFSQNVIDPPHLQRIDTTDALNRNYHGFMIGWNWGSPGARLDSVMNINSYHGFSNSKLSVENACAKNMLVIEPPGRWNSYIVGARGRDCAFNAHSLYLEPALTVDETQSFTPANWNKTGAVFGFRDKNSIGVTDTSRNGNFKLLTTNYNPDSAKVLYNIWQNDCFTWLDYYDSTDRSKCTNYKNINSQADKDTFHIFNGKQLYVSINIHADSIQYINNHLNDNIIGIKLRYALTKVDTTAEPDTLLPATYDYVKFDSIARESLSDTASIFSSINNQFRGKYRRLLESTEQPTEFIIKGNMLKIDNAGDTSNITLSALANFDGDTIQLIGGYKNNPRFKYDWWQNNYNVKEYITSIDVEVYYYGNLDVSIDWIRLETPRAQKVFRGGYDSAVSAAVDLLLDDINNNVNKPKLFRFYGDDELLPSQWAANRYLNMLVDTLAALECFTSRGNSPAHFLHSTGFKQYWNGANCDFITKTAVPFIRRARKDNIETFYYRWGYEGEVRTNDSLILNPLLSEYEIRLDKAGASFPITDPKIFEYEYGKDAGYISATSTQFQIEKYLYRNYYVYSSLYYSSKPWWANLWVHIDGIEFHNPEINSFVLKKGKRRPMTGEEVRLMVTHPILMGAKGLLYWKKGTENTFTTKGGFMGLQPNSNNYEELYGDLQGEDLLKSDLLGGDYLCFPDANGLDTSFNSAAFDFEKMGIDTNHIYLGLKSSRLTVSRINQWVTNCEDELMKLRLVAWYGKGYLTLQNHHPDYPDNVFNKYLAWDNARNRLNTTLFHSRPVGRYKYRHTELGYVSAPNYESWDSTFVDFTLLRNVEDSLNNLFYIGLQNRRTDPVVRYKEWTDPIYEEPILTIFPFYSTAEYDDSCDAAKNPDDYEIYRNYYIKRSGSREITLPFNYINPNNPDEYALLRITELGADSTFDSTWSYGRKLAYWNKIDTVIGQDRQITFNMLPGEGKIFKVQVLHPDYNVIGDLSYSNQSKLVSYPVIRPDGTESDSIRYHLVYHRATAFPGYTGNAVYYRRSKIVSKDCMEENIVWESAVLVSDSINDIQNPYISCDYPSIVVRKDIDTLKAYIVYSCFKSSASGMIVETILSVNDSIVLDKSGNKLADYSGSNRAEWGNPTVNASGNGNYYAWSDEAAGIVAAWKAPNQTSFLVNNTINFKYDINATAKHPSLNVYSHLDSLEDNCALVWQETPSPTAPSNSRILYTRLRDTSSNNIFRYLSPIFKDDSTTFGINNDIAVIGLTNSGSEYRYPVINRGLGFYFKHSAPALFKRRWDLVYWEVYNNDRIPRNNYLMNVAICNQDEDDEPIDWEVFWTQYVKSYIKCIGLPNIAQYFTSTASSSVYFTSLNFKYYNDLQNLEIGHFSYEHHSYVSSSESDSTDVNSLWVKRVDTGTFPHLSKNKQPLSGMWNNRRVYQKTISGTNHILSSAKYFYKGRSDEMLADWYIGFETADSSKKSFLFGAPELDEQRFSLKLPFEHIKTDEGYFALVETSSDTIASSWFSIENPKELALKLKGSNNANSKVYIQNKETERTLRLNLPNGLKENKGAKAKYNLINGLGNEFRLLFVKNDEDMHYTEELWIEGLPIEEKPAGSFKGNDGIENVDLIQIVNRYYSDHNISIFPNPASEVLYLQANVPFEEANLTVTNLLGTKVIQQQINLSKSPELKLDISFLLPGIYYVNISDGLKSLSGKFLKK